MLNLDRAHLVAIILFGLAALPACLDQATPGHGQLETPSAPNAPTPPGTETPDPDLTPTASFCGVEGTVVAVASKQEVRLYQADGESFVVNAPFLGVPGRSEVQDVVVTAGPGMFVVTVGWWIQEDYQGAIATALDLSGEVLWKVESGNHRDTVRFIGDDGAVVMWRHHHGDWENSHAVLVAADGAVTELAPGFHPLGPATLAGRIPGHMPELAGWLDLNTGEHTPFEAYSEKASVFMWGDDLVVVSAAPKELRQVPDSMVSDTLDLDYPGWLGHAAQAGDWLLMRGEETFLRLHKDGLTEDAFVLTPPDGLRLFDDCYGYGAAAIDDQGRILATLRDDDSAALWRYDLDADLWEQVGQASIGARMADIQALGSTRVTHYRDIHTYCPELEWGGADAPLVSDATEISAPGLTTSRVLGGFADVAPSQDGQCVAYRDRTEPNAEVTGKPVVLDTATGEELGLEDWGSIAFARP